MLRSCLLAATLIVVSGCYFRAEVHDFTPEPGTAVRVTLTADSNPGLWSVLGRMPHIVEGHVLSGGADTLALALSHVERFDGHGEPWHGERVGVPRSSVVRIERRWLSLPATVGLVGGVMVGLVLAGKAVARPPVLH